MLMLMLMLTLQAYRETKTADAAVQADVDELLLRVHGLPRQITGASGRRCRSLTDFCDQSSLSSPSSVWL